MQWSVMSVMVAHREEERQDGTKYQHEEFRLGETSRFVPRSPVTVAQGSDLRENVDRGHVEEGPGTEQHGEPGGGDGVETAATPGLQQHEGQDGSTGGGQREDEEMFLDPSSLQSLMQEVGHQTEAGGRLVKHDGQEDDHLHIRLVGRGGGSQSDPVSRGVNHQAEGGGPADRPRLPALQVRLVAATGGHLVDDQHEDEAEHQGDSDEMVARVLPALVVVVSAGGPSLVLVVAGVTGGVGHVQSLHSLWNDDTESCAQQEAGSHHTDELQYCINYLRSDFSTFAPGASPH